MTEAELHRGDHESARVGHRFDLLSHQGNTIDSARVHLGQELVQRLQSGIEVVVAIDDHLETLHQPL